MGGLPGPTENSQDKEQVHSQFPASTAPPSKSAAHQAKLPSRAGMTIFVLIELHRNNTIAFYFPVREFFFKVSPRQRLYNTQQGRTENATDFKGIKVFVRLTGSQMKGEPRCRPLA